MAEVEGKVDCVVELAGTKHTYSVPVWAEGLLHEATEKIRIALERQLLSTPETARVSVNELERKQRLIDALVVIAITAEIQNLQARGLQLDYQEALQKVRDIQAMIDRPPSESESSVL